MSGRSTSGWRAANDAMPDFGTARLREAAERRRLEGKWNWKGIYGGQGRGPMPPIEELRAQEAAKDRALVERFTATVADAICRVVHARRPKVGGCVLCVRAAEKALEAQRGWHG